MLINMPGNFVVCFFVLLGFVRLVVANLLKGLKSQNDRKILKKTCLLQDVLNFLVLA